MQRPDGSSGGQPAGMTIGSILRMALKAYAGGGLSSGGAAATETNFGSNGGLVGAVGPEAANSITAAGDAGGQSGGMGLMQMMGNAATSKIGGKGNQQFSADRTPGVSYNSGVVTDPMLKFYNPYQQQGY